MRWQNMSSQCCDNDKSTSVMSRSINLYSRKQVIKLIIIIMWASMIHSRAPLLWFLTSFKALTVALKQNNKKLNCTCISPPFILSYLWDEDNVINVPSSCPSQNHHFMSPPYRSTLISCHLSIVRHLIKKIK